MRTLYKNQRTVHNRTAPHRRNIQHVDLSQFFITPYLSMSPNYTRRRKVGGMLDGSTKASNRNNQGRALHYHYPLCGCFCGSCYSYRILLMNDPGVGCAVGDRSTPPANGPLALTSSGRCWISPSAIYRCQILFFPQAPLSCQFHSISLVV